jgi:hypothetical protein
MPSPYGQSLGGKWVLLVGWSRWYEHAFLIFPVRGGHHMQDVVSQSSTLARLTAEAPIDANQHARDTYQAHLASGVGAAN